MCNLTRTRIPTNYTGACAHPETRTFVSGRFELSKTSEHQSSPGDPTRGDCSRGRNHVFKPCDITTDHNEGRAMHFVDLRVTGSAVQIAIVTTDADAVCVRKYCHSHRRTLPALLSPKHSQPHCSKSQAKD